MTKEIVNDYRSYLDTKSQGGADSGFDPVWMPSFLFDFQAAMVDWALRKGRAAIFADCGLGKTPMGLTWASNVARKTGKPVLYLTPLAVASQTVREAHKFDIDAIHSKDGASAGHIVVANYERLHYFTASDFSGVVCDECFAAGTLVDTPNGRKRIEHIREGMYITNAAGVDRVSDVHRREVSYAVRVATATANFISSPNHPIFTQRGWVGAQHLRAGDYALESAQVVRMVREGVFPEVPRSAGPTVLRDILLSEMADVSAGDIGGSPLGRSGGEAWRQEGSVVRGEEPRRGEGTCTDIRAESNDSPGGEGEVKPHIESHEARTFRAWGKWTATDSAAVDPDGCFGRRMGGGVAFVTGPKASRLSDELQARLRQSEDEIRHRGGWAYTSQPEGAGHQEGFGAGWVRVDGIEVLEPGNNDLEQLRDADGKLYFYDLGATRHPSYSVNGLLVHNSSILKSFAGQRRGEITAFMRKVPYRLLQTATAAPNDYVELGTSSEALGYMGHMDMLNRFFKNDLNNSATGRMRGEVIKWRLKGHAEQPFWRWVCSWARAIRRPSDLGFDDSAFVLPPLIENEHLVEAQTLADGMLFAMPAVGLKEQREERRRTVQERCERVAALVNNTGQPALVWCHLNDEGDMLEKLIPDAVQVSGSDSDERKEDRLEAFADGRARILITKPKIGALGLNLQHCNHITFFPSHSFEQYYQGVRRCWRFGQTRPVTVDIVTTEGERGVTRNLQRKAAQADTMFSHLVASMADSLSIARAHQGDEKINVPTWLKSVS